MKYKYRIGHAPLGWFVARIEDDGSENPTVNYLHTTGEIKSYAGDGSGYFVSEAMAEAALGYLKGDFLPENLFEFE